MSNTTIQLRKSGQTGNTPADLAHGELAINYADGKLFYKNGVGIKSIENQKTFSTINANNSLIIATTPTDILSLAAGSNILIDTNTVTKTVTISVPGGSSIDVLARERAQAAYDEANTQNVINQTQNTWITNTNTFAGMAAFTANQAWVGANTANGNISALQAQMTTTNTNVTSVNTFAQSGFNSANAGVTLATAAYSQANNASGNTVALQSQVTTTNTNISNLNTYASAAYGKANAEGEINNTQNTWITNTNTFAQAAYNFANTRFSSSGGTISGNVTIQNDLSVLGNVNFVGNVTSITVTGNSGQFFGYASNGHNALYAGIPVGYDFQPFTIFQASANYDGYSQINIQNINNGLDASSDLVATADNGTENDTYIDMGIGSSQHTDPEYTLVGPNDGYLYVSGNTTTGGGDLVLGTFLPQNDVVIAAGGMNSENEQMRFVGASNTIIIRSNVNSSLSKSVLLGPVANVRITGGSSGQILRTDGAGNLSFINSPVDLATAAFSAANTAAANTIAINTLATAAYSQANNASGNTIALQAVNTLQNTNITSVNTFAGSAFNSANSGVTLATAAYSQANNASGNTVALQAQMTTTNTNITSVNTFTQAGFNSANAGVTLATAAYAQANTAAGNTVALQAQMSTTNTNVTSVNTFAGAAFNSANAGVILATAAYAQANNASGNTVALQAVNTTQNTNITAVNTFAGSAFNSANAGVTLATAAFGAANTAAGNTVALQSQMTITNTNVTAVNTFTQAGFNSANAGVTLATAAYSQANNASGNTIALQSQMTTTNTNITSVNTFAGSAFNSANAGVTLATAAYSQANNASGNTVALQAVNTTQNTNITSVNTFAQAAFNEANGAVQTGFTTIAANSINITPTSNADTLTITAGNNISISACTTTRTITIASTASGGGGGGGTLTYNTSPPATGNTVGDRWVDSDDGTLYTYINDGNSFQWVDFSTSATLASVGGGSANAILYQAGVGNTTFTSVGTQGQLLMAGVGGVPIWAAQTALRIANTQITGRVTSDQIANTTVGIGTYGGSTAIPVITIDQQGRITVAANASITSGTTITDETISASSYYPVLTTATTGSISTASVSSTKLTYVPSTGTLSSTVITSTSDEKLKTNISTIQNPIDTVKQLRGVEYNWKDNGQKSMGVVAQEVEKILPYLVVESNDGKSVMYQNMIGLLIEAIKEQQKQIDELRGKLNAD